MTPAIVATIAIPAGAVVIAPAPALWGPPCAAYLGMTEEQARRTLADMARDPAHASSVVVLTKRPLAHAAPPGDVMRFLRSRRDVVAVELARPETEPQTEEAAEAAVLRRLGLRG